MLKGQKEGFGKRKGRKKDTKKGKIITHFRLSMKWWLEGGPIQYNCFYFHAFFISSTSTWNSLPVATCLFTFFFLNFLRIKLLKIYINLNRFLRVFLFSFFFYLFVIYLKTLFTNISFFFLHFLTCTVYWLFGLDWPWHLWIKKKKKSNDKTFIVVAL